MKSLAFNSVKLPLGILLFTLLFQLGCSTDEPEFESPIILSNISDGDAFECGCLIVINVDFEAHESGTIAELKISIDLQVVAVTQDFPCYYEWDSGDEETGEHHIKFTILDLNGKSYSEERSIRIYKVNTQPCPEAEIVMDWDGNSYHTIQIGAQCWMKENLKTTHYSDGTPLLNGTGMEDTRYDTTNKYYFIYNNDTSYISTYGLLYIWKAAVNGYSSEEDQKPSEIQGVCPAGWHLPSDSEWKELEIYLGMSVQEANERSWRGSIEGGMLKEAGTSHWAHPNMGATNESGFFALPGGNRSMIGNYEYLGEKGSFWTSTNHIAYNQTHNPAYRLLEHDEARIWRYQGFHDYITYARSVRCVRDE